jgi:RNA recognition motif. (a.k.a. RRM, RBD, or RNP domain)
MATVTLRPVVQGIPSVTTRVKYPNYPFSRTLFLRKQKPLALQISPITARRISAYAYAESDTEVEKQEQEDEASKFVNETEGETETVEAAVLVQPDKPAPKRLRKDRARLYVGSIPFSTTANDLAELFSEAGTVNSVDVRFVTLIRCYV